MKSTLPFVWQVVMRFPLNTEIYRVVTEMNSDWRIFFLVGRSVWHDCVGCKLVDLCLRSRGGSKWLIFMRLWNAPFPFVSSKSHYDWDNFCCLVKFFTNPKQTSHQFLWEKQHLNICILISTSLLCVIAYFKCYLLQSKVIEESFLIISVTNKPINIASYLVIILQLN